MVGSSPRGRGKLGPVKLAPRVSRLIPAWAGKTGRGSGSRCPSAAHPRVGGENRRVESRRAVRLGSSPRGRGKPKRRRRARHRPGLIPAWAGKTRQKPATEAKIGAHPRVGGENHQAGGNVVGKSGSSPRGRGKQVATLGAPPLRRLIPAWAGKTILTGDAIRVEPAHPRVGGENLSMISPSESISGSSPRGRGKRLHGAIRSRQHRLIPAWAGKTGEAGLYLAANGAHPRVGGENAMTPRVRSRLAGSSPRGRGKRPRTVWALACPRLIPAWAGKTDLPHSLPVFYTAHPRVGGENRPIRRRRVNRDGSSPRGRGKHGDTITRIEKARLIPAWAGKTVGGRRRRLAARLIPAWAGKTPLLAPLGDVGEAHPRVGGENKYSAVASPSLAGSSPRGRGKRHERVWARVRQGLIPAWAGKTNS